MLQLGDNTKLIKDITDESVGLVCADFDYGFGQISKRSWNKQDLAICDDMVRIIKHNGVIVLFASGRFTFELYDQLEKYYRYMTIWDKGRVTGHLNAKVMPMLRHENLMIFAKGRHTYNPQKTKGAKPHSIGKALHRIDTDDSIYGSHKRVNAPSDMKYPQSIIQFAAVNPQVKIWPTEKPLSLLEYIVKTYSNEGDVVVDPACGSGKTLIAAKKFDRQWIGIDKDPKALKLSKRGLSEII